MVLVIRPVPNGGMMVPKKPLGKLLLGYNATKVYSKRRIQLFGNSPWANGAMV